MSFTAVLVLILIYMGFIWAFLTAGLAIRLGRGEAADGWGVAGFVFGPLALAILYARGRKEPVLYPVAPEERGRWDALCRADRHVALAGAKAREIDEACERDLLLMYFALNDRQQLPHLLRTAIEAAEIRKRDAAQIRAG